MPASRSTPDTARPSCPSSARFHLARRIVARESDVSRTACANEIAEIVAADDTIELQPDSKWIAGHINELFERRPGPRVEYRPKTVKGVGDDHWI